MGLGKVLVKFRMKYGGRSSNDLVVDNIEVGAFGNGEGVEVDNVSRDGETDHGGYQSHH